MSAEQLSPLIALKFAEDYGKYITTYYNSPWKPIDRKFPTNRLVKVPSVFHDIIGIASICGPVVRHMYKQTANLAPIFPVVLETESLEALFIVKDQALRILNSSKFSFIVMCSWIAKCCRSFILSGKSVMASIPLIALADIIVEEGIATTHADWQEYARLALRLMENKVKFDTMEQCDVNKKIAPVTTSTFWS